jgi:hypothetical protein
VSLLCPELIGRAAEVASLRERVDAMAAGRAAARDNGSAPSRAVP